MDMVLICSSVLDIHSQVNFFSSAYNFANFVLIHATNLQPNYFTILCLKKKKLILKVQWKNFICIESIFHLFE